MVTTNYQQSTPFYWLSEHARVRLNQRSRLSARQLAVLIHHGSILLGLEQDREHKILWSPVDDLHFVTIYDTKNLEIVTVLPPDYHNRCAFRIDEEMYERSKKHVERDPNLLTYIMNMQSVNPVVRLESLPWSIRRLAMPGVSVVKK